MNSYTKSHSAATSSSISNVKIGERLIARIQVDNTGTATSTNQYRLQWRASAGTWADLSTTTAIRYSLSTKGALWGRPGGVPLTSKQVTASCGASTAFTEGRFVAGTATSTAFDIGPSKCTELAFAIETGGATLGTTYELRVVSASTTTLFDSYAVTPTFTIESARTLTYSKEARGAATSTQNAIGSAYTSIAIGTDGFPVISYQGASNFLEVAHCTNAACTGTPAPVVQNAVNSQYTSIAIGTDGFPVISYRNNATGFLEVAHCQDITCASRTITAQNAVSSVFTSIAIGTDGFPGISYRNDTSTFLEVAHCGNGSCVGTTSPLAYLPNTSASLATFLDDGGYTNVATSDDLYDSLFAATSSKLAYNFKKASTTNTDQITVTWEGQVSVSTSTSLQLYNYTNSAWTNLETNLTPTGGSDFTLTGTQSTSLSDYYSSNIVTARVVTGTTTAATTLKTDNIAITFSAAVSLTLSASTDVFGTLTPGTYKFATSTISVLAPGADWNVTTYGNNQGSIAASTTLYYSTGPDYSIGIPDQTEWIPGAATTSAGNAVVRGSLDSSGNVLAFRVMTASGSSPFRAPTWWGANDDDGTAKWAGIASTTASNKRISISSVAALTEQLGTVQYYLNVPTTQQAGAYTGDITFTLTGAP
ncbi:MAG: hypothetical protein HYT94_01385 [Parcubacteria group bacterium]|nr:hypothetical protein [Parcubacteria group bacterium]